MYAFEAKEKSIKPQYEYLKKIIEKNALLGKSSCTVYFFIFLEVLNILSSEGFDVKVGNTSNGTNYAKISWSDAWQGKTGKITRIN